MLMSRQKSEERNHQPKGGGGKTDNVGDDSSSKSLNAGAVVSEAGNSIRHRTGDWRTFRPVVDLEKCTGCGICVKFCPDSSLKLVDMKGKKKIVVDYEHCKGCLICVTECPFKAYTTEREKQTNTCEFKMHRVAGATRACPRTGVLGGKEGFI